MRGKIDYQTLKIIEVVYGHISNVPEHSPLLKKLRNTAIPPAKAATKQKQIVEDLRVEKGYSLTGMSELMNMNGSWYKLWRDSKTKPKKEHIIKLAKVLDVPIETLQK